MITKSVKTNSFIKYNSIIESKYISEEELISLVARAKENKKSNILKVTVFLHNLEFEFKPESYEYPVNVILCSNLSNEKKVFIEIQTIQILKKDLINFEYIEKDNKKIGYIFKSNVEKLLFLTNLNNKHPSLKEELYESFLLCEENLNKLNLSPKNISRTWYYIHNISNNYVTLNLVRDFFFKKWEIESLPASTGISANFPNKHYMLCSFEAIQSTKDILEVATELQCRPTDYGMKFVRANLVDHFGEKTLNISGISSINTDGISIWTDDIYKHIKHSMDSFLSLLDKVDMNTSNLFSVYIYFKSRKVKEIYDTYIKDTGISIDYIYIFVDICRSDLLFEIEAKAIK